MGYYLVGIGLGIGACILIMVVENSLGTKAHLV